VENTLIDVIPARRLPPDGRSGRERAGPRRRFTGGALALGILAALAFSSAAPVLAQSAPSPAVEPMQAGRDLMASGDASAAAQRFAEAVRLAPNDPVALNNLATARAALGDYTSALGLLREALSQAPGRDDIRTNYEALQRWLASRSAIVLESPNEDAAPLPEGAANTVVPPLWGGSAGAAEPLPALRTLRAGLGGDVAGQVATERISGPAVLPSIGDR
jgi:tetratricopeptide (TPR) repeat protein